MIFHSATVRAAEIADPSPVFDLQFGRHWVTLDTMILSRKDIEHVAHLGRLELSEEEIELYTKQLNQILDYFKKLEELDTENVTPTSHAVPMEMTLREDEARLSNVTEDALSQAPEQTNNLFLVPKIIE